MEQTEKTWDEIIEFIELSNTRRDKDTKINHHIVEISKQLFVIQTDRQAEITKRHEDARIEYCATDEKGIILREANGAKRFTKDGERKFNQAVEEIDKELVSKKYKVTPFYMNEEELAASKITLTEREREVYKGFIIE